MTSLRHTVLKELTNRTTPRYMDMAFGTWGFPEHDPALLRLKIAHNAFRGAWERIHTAHAAHMRDETKMPLMRLLSSAELAEKISSRAEGEFEAAKSDAEKRLKELRSKAEEHLALPHASGHAQLHGEIRAHFSKLSSDERSKKAQAAMQSGDLGTIKALISAPPFLSGIGDPMHKRLRAEYLAKVAPEEVRLGTEIEGALEMVSRAHGEFMEHIGAELDWSAVDTARKARAL